MCKAKAEKALKPSEIGPAPVCQSLLLCADAAFHGGAVGVGPGAAGGPIGPEIQMIPARGPQTSIDNINRSRHCCGKWGESWVTEARKA